MITLAPLLASLLGTVSSIHVNGSAAVQFYWTEGPTGSVELWTPNGSTWSSVLDPNRTMQPPADAESRKACDIHIEAEPPFLLRGMDASRAEGLKNPVLFLEGLDFFDESPLDANGTHRDLTAWMFMNKLWQAGISSTLERDGHDVLTLNFEHSSIDIRRNGEYSAQVLRWVSSNLMAGSKAPYVVGVSMGGLVGRWAIHRYENGLRTASMPRIPLFISLDAPHQGANVPMAVMNILAQLNSFQAGKGDAAVLDNLLNSSMAARQLLLRNKENIPDPEFTAFQRDYLQRRVLPGTRQVAISNGSMVGTAQEYIPGYGSTNTDPLKLGKPLSDVLRNKNSFHVSRSGRYSLNIISIVGLSATTWGGLDQTNPSWYAHFYAKDGLLSEWWNGDDEGSWSAPIAYDLAPGGFLPFFAMIYHPLNTNIDKAIKDNGLYSSRDERNLESAQGCFVPTVSAIDYLKPDGSPAITDGSLVFANLEGLDPDVARHTSFAAVYGVGSSSLSRLPSAWNAGFLKNQLHIDGLSEDNTYRIGCEVAYVDGKVSDPSTCASSANDPGWANTVYHTVDLTGSNGAPAWTGVRAVNDRYTYPSSSDPFVAKHQDALVWSGTPVAGWRTIAQLPYMIEANDQIYVDVYVPPGRYNYLAMTGVLKNAEDGCGYLTVSEKPLNTTTGGWQRVTWTVPSWYSPECGNSGGIINESKFELILNTPVPSWELRMTGLFVKRGTEIVSTLPKLPPDKAQVVPFAPGSKFLLGNWGQNTRDAESKGYLGIVFDAPWTGAVLYNAKGVDVSDYMYLQVEAKGSVPASSSGMMIFADDRPTLSDDALVGTGKWRDPGRTVNPWGKSYNYWASMKLISTSADGYETRRVPLAWIAPSGALQKILIQHASWNGKASNESWTIRSMKFTN